ncbi:MAG: S-layer homology domain-containing protein [Eubacteriales bacterium]|nr:S-layer homology domain-containing protein [Eubacteriales bacterium]
MKKIFSVMLVVAMLLSLVTINVAAEGGINVKFTASEPIVANADADQEVAIDFVIESNAGITSFAADFSFDETNLQLVKVEDKKILPGYLGYNGNTNLTKRLSWGDDLATENITATGVAATLTFKVLKSAAPADYAITLTPRNDDIYDKDMSPVACTSENGNIKVIEESDVKSLATPATANVVYGGSLADALKDAKVTVNTETTATKKAGTATLAVEWNVTGLSTTPDKLDDTTKTLTVPGTLVLPSGYTNTTNTAASATVTITPITDGTVAEAKGNVMENAENGITEDAIKAALPAELEVVKGDFKDTFTVAWNTVEGYANEGKDYRANDVITVKGTLTSPSKNGLFTTATTDVDGKVTVVPAEIKGGSISINNPIDNGYVTANITVPASEIAKMPLDAEGDSDEVKAEKKAKRTISLIVPNADSTKEGATVSVEVTAEQIAAANEADAKDLNVTLKSDKKMKELGYSSSGTKNFTVNVTVGGTTLLNGDSKDAVSGEVKKATSSSAGGINKGGSTTTTYAVTVVETKNGTATVSPEKAASGATVTVKAEPAEGYKVKSVTAVKADGTNVPVDEKALTFTMPASAVKVTVEFEEGKDEPSVDPTPAEDKFADVADDFWAAKDIYTLKDAGIIGGKSATEFDPEGDVTRAEFAKMVVGLFGYKATSDAVNFEDCKAEDWFTPYVAAGVEAGVIKGVSDTEFAPNATITREDACTILGRALNKVAQSNELKFTDADKVAEYAAPYVALLSELGYVNGYEDGSFAPTNNITRAEAAKIIAGIYNANKSAETVTDDKTETDANADAAVDEKVEEKTDEKAVDTIETEPEK